MVNYNPFFNPYPLFQAPAPVATQSAFIDIANEAEARSYPVEPGKSVAFKDTSEENIYYTKTAGTTALDAPIFKKFRMVEEELPIEAAVPAPAENAIDLSGYALKSEITALIERIDEVQKEVTDLKKEWEG